jgi:hypothetical protein
MNAADQINRCALLDVDDVRNVNASTDQRAVASSVETKVVHASGVMTAEQEQGVGARISADPISTTLPKHRVTIRSIRRAVANSPVSGTTKHARSSSPASPTFSQNGRSFRHWSFAFDHAAA